MGKLNLNNPLFNTPTEPAEEAAEPKKMGRPRKSELVRDNSAQAGLTEEWQRATFIVKVSALEDLKSYAYTKRIPLKTALTEVIEKFIADYKADPENEELLPAKK